MHSIGFLTYKQSKSETPGLTLSVLTFTPSAQRYSYFGPAHIVGQLVSVQHSVSVPYRMEMALKKSTVFTASLRRASAA